MEVHVTCSPETAQERDPKGLYEKAKKGEIKGLTGFDGTYEEPESAELVVNTDDKTVDEILDMILSKI
jgi:adenylylsulfate kinase-like enzyme